MYMKIVFCVWGHRQRVCLPPSQGDRLSTFSLASEPTHQCTRFWPLFCRFVEKLDMPPEVAGVTFLAFGNGAPDVFSAFVALTSSTDKQDGLLVGIGSLLGSSESRPL